MGVSRSKRDLYRYGVAYCIEHDLWAPDHLALPFALNMLADMFGRDEDEIRADYAKLANNPKACAAILASDL